MASSGSFSGSIKDGHYKLRIDWSQTKNISENSSTLTLKIYLVNDYSLDISGRTDNTLTISGTTSKYSSPAITTTGTHLLNTISKTILHNSDGSKNISVSSAFYIRATISGTYYESITASANITLDSIPRASTISAKDTILGNATTISINRASSNFTHTLQYTFGNISENIVVKTSDISILWTPNITLANQIPSSITGTCTITCTTYNGTTNIGTSACTLKLTVPSDIKPTISKFIISKLDNIVPNDWNIYIKSKSMVKLNIESATGSYGSSITSYSISGGGYSSNSSTLTTGFLNVSGNITFIATVTDSRGRVSNNATITINVVDYSQPSFDTYISQRCTSNGILSNDGTFVKSNVSFKYYNCNNKNTITTSVYYKKSTDTDWINANTSFTSNTDFLFGNGKISPEYTYDIKYTVEDNFTTISIVDIVSTANVVMDFKFGGKGIAIGKVSELDNTFEVAENWQIKVYGKLLKDYILDTIYPIDSIYLSVNSTTPSTLFGGTWEQLQSSVIDNTTIYIWKRIF